MPCGRLYTVPAGGAEAPKEDGAEAEDDEFSLVVASQVRLPVASTRPLRFRQVAYPGDLGGEGVRNDLEAKVAGMQAFDGRVDAAVGI